MLDPPFRCEASLLLEDQKLSIDQGYIQISRCIKDEADLLNLIYRMKNSEWSFRGYGGYWSPPIKGDDITDIYDKPAQSEDEFLNRIKFWYKTTNSVMFRAYWKRFPEDDGRNFFTVHQSNEDVSFLPDAPETLKDSRIIDAGFYLTHFARMFFDGIEYLNLSVHQSIDRKIW